MNKKQDGILNKIRSGVVNRQHAIRIITNDKKLKKDVIAHVLKNSGTPDDGLMIYHDSIIAFVKKVFTNHDFILEGSVSAYIYGIGRNLWFAKLKKDTRNPIHQAKELDHNNEEIDDWIHTFENLERNKVIQGILKHLKVNCKQVLMYWAGGYKMKEIAAILGYKSEGVVRKKKHQCFKELVDWLEQHPDIKNELKK